MELTKDYVRNLFKYLETHESDKFFAEVSDNVDWTVMGTHPLAGQYYSKEAFLNATFRRLNKVLQNGVILKVNHVFLDGNIAIVEMTSLSMANNGKPFDNRYCWVVTLDENLKIVNVRAYLDSFLVNQVIKENDG